MDDVCDKLEELDIFSLSNSQINALRFVAGDSGVQGTITFNTLRPFLDAYVIPVGFTVDWWGESPPPENWLVMDGSTFSEATYPDLSIFLSSNTLPDYRDKTTEGATLDPNNVGEVYGLSAYTLSASQMLEHRHAYTDTIGIRNLVSVGDHHTNFCGGWSFEGDDRFRCTADPIEELRDTSPVGGNTEDTKPVNNIQPTVVVNKIIKAK